MLMKNKESNKLFSFSRACKINYKYLCEVFKDDPAYLIVLSFMTVFNTVFPLVNIIIPKIVIDSILLNGSIMRISLLIAILFVSNVFFGVLNSVLSSQYLSIRGSMSSMRFLTKIARKASELDLSQIEQKKTRDMMEMAKNVIYRGIHNNIITSISGLFGSVIMVVTSIGIVANSSAYIIFIIVFVCILSTIINFRIERDSVEVQSETQKIMTRMNYYTDLLEGNGFNKEIRLYNLGGWIESHCSDTMKLIKMKLIEKNRKWSGWRVFQCIMSNGLNYGAYMFFAILAIMKRITIGDFTMYFQSVSSFRTNFDSCLSVISQIMLNSEYISAYNSFMDMNSELNNTLKKDTASLGISDHNNYTICMHDVSFKYFENGPMILKNINLELLPHGIYAIVGENGAGKSTLVNLLCRFYDITEGEILINNTDIRNFSICEYRNLFSALFQGFNNIAFPVKDNIALEKPFDENKANLIIDSLGLRGCIEELRNRYNTYLTKTLDDEGIYLSGGQNQRLAIARSIYRNAPFVILDEPTSALDPLAEDALIRLIRTHMEGKTILYVSHRLASVHMADKVIYIHNNTVEGFGAHEELYKQNLNYQEFYDAQAKYYR